MTDIKGRAMSQRSDPRRKAPTIAAPLPSISHDLIRRSILPTLPHVAAVQDPASRTQQSAAKNGSSTSRWLAVDDEAVRSSLQLRILARQTHSLKPRPSVPTMSPRATVALNPLPINVQRKSHYVHVDRSANTTTSNNHVIEDENERLKEMWAVAAAAARRQSHKPARVDTGPSTLDRLQNNQADEDPHFSLDRTIQSLDMSLPNGTTLARYRRLVGMHARSTLVQILREAARRVARHRLETASARPVQRAARRFLGRRRRDRLWYAHVEAALLIQRTWRRTLARREVQQRRNMKQQRDAKRLHAALVIQQVYRRYAVAKAHRLLQDKRMRRQWRAVRLLVAAVRAWQTRKRVTRETPSTPQPHQAVSDAGSTVDPLEVTCGQADVHEDGDSVDGNRSAELDVDHITCLDDTLAVAQQQQQREECREPVAVSSPCEPVASEDMEMNAFPDLVESVEPRSTRQVTTMIQSLLPAKHQQRDPTLHKQPLPGSCQQSRIHPTTPSVDAPSTTLPSSIHTSENQHESGLVYDTASSVLVEQPIQLLPWHSHRMQESQREIDAVASPSMTPSMSSAEPSLQPQTQDRTHHAQRTLTHFLIRYVRPTVLVHMQVKRGASLRIQRCVREWMARRHVQFCRQLHVLSLKSELQVHWQQIDASPLASTLDTSSRTVAGRSPTHSHYTRELEDDDDDDDDDEALEDLLEGPDSGVDCGPPWIETLPTRNGVFPPGLRIRFASSHGAASQSAPSLGLWRWSWGTEKWEPNRDVFNLALRSLTSASQR